jgi:glycosyltransferase involved in cell wall biosynthesis
MSSKKTRIGFVSTRFSGTDGVSMETKKWVKVLRSMGHKCFFFAGVSDWESDRSYVVEEAHFDHPEIRLLNVDLFDDYRRDPSTSHRIHELSHYLKNHLIKFIKRFNVEILIVENALALPMNVPLGLALTELIAEDSIPTIAHHHDFTWERERYVVSAAEDYLNGSFPPTLHQIRHVVINTYAQRQLALRTGVSSTLVPNVMDFDNPPKASDGYTEDMRLELGVGPQDCFLLQPTRIVPRKRIEQAIELTRRLDMEASLVITHHAGDEDSDYQEYLQHYATLIGVRVLFAADRFAVQRGRSPSGQKIYSLEDAYRQANIVTYPSRVEGFGNAFLETIYYKRPIVMSTYEIFKTDIQPKGFKIITFDDYIGDDCVRQVKDILEHPEKAKEMVAHNYELGCQHYSFTMLKNRLGALLNEVLGLEAEVFRS